MWWLITLQTLKDVVDRLTTTSKDLQSVLGIKPVFLYHNSQQLKFRSPKTAAAKIPYSTINTYQASYHHIGPTYFIRRPGVLAFCSNKIEDCVAQNQ